jgi:hypothetical protein
MDLGEIGFGGCGLDSTSSGQGPVAGCCECGDEPSGSCATELLFSLAVFIETYPLKAFCSYSVSLNFICKLSGHYIFVFAPPVGHLTCRVKRCVLTGQHASSLLYWW